MSKKIARYTPLFTAVALCFVTTVGAEDGFKKGTVYLGNGKVKMNAPSTWESKEPKFKGIVSAEFTVKPAKGEENPARVTIGGSGGGADANLKRWEGQYSNAKTEKKEEEINGQKVHWIDIQGTYKGSSFRREPSGPGFRLLGAFIQTEKAGSYYVKFYGRAKTVEENKKAFEKMVKSVKVSE